MKRSQYSSSYLKFIEDTPEQILGELSKNHTFSTLLDTQKNAWIEQINILKEEFKNTSFDRILFEYSIPRMGKRVDNVVFYQGVVYIIEFKVGATEYSNTDLKQTEGYAIDLKNFQEASKDLKIVPILVSTEAPEYSNTVEMYDDGVTKPLRANAKNLSTVMLKASAHFQEEKVDVIAWENSVYRPTPTIIEAAQALFEGHTVEEITKSDSGENIFYQTSEAIEKIIADSKRNSKKSIIFVTGIPGSGKTLIGMNIASKYQNIEEQEHAVYLCGTVTLITILQEALARDKVANSLTKITKKEALRNAQTLFQFLPEYRKEAMLSDEKPHEKITVYDEAQRMWEYEKLDDFVTNKMHRPATGKSEPDVLIGYMDRNPDWSVMICLLGGGQEIHKGEDGTVEWLKSIKNNFPHWNVYLSKELSTKEYLNTVSVEEALSGVKHTYVEELHLKTSTRSFRAENLSKFVNCLLDRKVSETASIVKTLEGKYPLYITRDLDTAKKWIKNRARGTERYGIFASSQSHRLHPTGITTRKPMDFRPQAWWLDSEEYVDSSLYLEIPATEFLCQGLEVDWAIIGWDASLRPLNDDWSYQTFSRKEWRTIHKKELIEIIQKSSNKYRKS